MLKLLKQIVVDNVVELLADDVRTIYEAFHPSHVQQRSIQEFIRWFGECTTDINQQIEQRGQQ